MATTATKALKAAATTVPSSGGGSRGGFVPRAVFEVSSSITRSYFLGHHTKALSSMRKTLSNIGLILECRDSRVPLTSANPLLESALAGRDRIIVYTKTDLCAPRSSKRWLEEQQRLLAKWHALQQGRNVAFGTGAAERVEREEEEDSDNVEDVMEGERERDERVGGRTEVIFTDERNPRSISLLLSAIKERAAAHDSLLGLRALVVGMPNAGKSTLLNALRSVGMQMPKAAKTGSEPGVTRNFSTPVRIAPPSPSISKSSTNKNDKYAEVRAATYSLTSNEPDIGEGVFIIDTPGVFIPYVSSLESMLKLSLVGCVKDGLVPSTTLADYLLFLLNRRDPKLYSHLCSYPTNDIYEFLDAVAKRTGKLLKGGEPAREQAADWVVQRWRRGFLGRFGLDDEEVSEEGLRERARRLLERKRQGGGGGEGGGEDGSPLSMSQARKREKEARKVRSAAKRAANLDSGG